MFLTGVYVVPFAEWAPKHAFTFSSCRTAVYETTKTSPRSALVSLALRHPPLYPAPVHERIAAIVPTNRGRN